MHSNWRDCSAWRSMGLPMSTTSNEACKLYDASITQLISFSNDDTLGGMEKTIENSLKADPDFVMGRVLANSMKLRGCPHKVRQEPDTQAAVDHLVKLAENTNVTLREKKHIKATQCLAEGSLADATRTWMDILVEYPTDLQALKLAFDGCFIQGWQRQQRDLMLRVLPHWTPDMPHYGYLKGMQGFALQETLMYSEGEKAARQGLEMVPSDIWAAHALSHILYMNSRHDEGLAHLQSTENNWQKGDMLACHVYWHWCIHHLEKGDFQSALDVFDNEILPRAKNPQSSWNIADAASFLKRLEFEGVHVGNRWKQLKNAAELYAEDHMTCFADTHIMMLCVNAKEDETAQRFMSALRNFANTVTNGDSGVVREVGVPLCEAFQAYEAGDFDQAVDLLYPIKYKIVEIGGSNAQRDVFDLYLINAALKSPRRTHRKLARQLLMERKALNEKSPLTDRLMARCLASHVD